MIQRNPDEPERSEPEIAVRAQDVIADPDVLTLIDKSDEYLDAIGYTYHGRGHVTRVARRAGYILEKLGAGAPEINLAKIAGYLHDIGNVVHREGHPQHSALMSFTLLREMGMPMTEIATVMGAISNHDEHIGQPTNNVAAALIIADKSDVLRTRVRSPSTVGFDIHDRVNYAATSSDCQVDPKQKVIAINLEIDPDISSVVDYFEIFLSRMIMSRKAAAHLNCDLALNVNGVKMM